MITAKVRDALVVLFLCAFALWMTTAFVSELRIEQRLTGEQRTLQQQNDDLQAANDAYKKDIGALKSGAGAEEEARMNGYAKSGEQVIVLVPPSPSPSPVSTASPHP